MTVFSTEQCFYKIKDVEHHLNPDFFKKETIIPMTNSNKLELLVDCLYQFSIFARDYNITYSVVSGTLLGAVRHEGIMPWDNDLDIAIFGKNNYVKINILKNKFNSKFTIKNYITGFKLYYYEEALGEIFIMDLLENKYIYSGPYINNKPYYIMNYVFPFISYLVEDIFPLKNHKFENFNVCVPNNYEKILKQNYNSNVLTEYRYNPNHNKLHDSKYALIVLYIFLKIYTKLYIFKIKHANKFIGNIGNRIMNKTFKHFR